MSSELQVRPYQQRMLESLIEGMQYFRTQLVQSATGTGKTIGFLLFLQWWFGQGGRKAMIIAHTDELVQQPQDKAADFFGDLVEAGIGVVKAQRFEINNPLIVASMQTLQQMDDLSWLDDVDLVVIDEAHHDMADGRRRWIAKHLKGKFVIGFTATPVRTDEQPILGTVYERMAFKYTIKEAIRDGWLAPFDAYQFEIRAPAGRYTDVSAVARAANAHEHAYNRWREYADGVPFVGFCATVELAEEWAEWWTERGVPCAAVHGGLKDDERQQILADYESGKYIGLWNVYVLTEGWDSPKTKALLFVRNTDSALVVAQALGRVLRPHNDRRATALFFTQVSDMDINMENVVVGDLLDDEDEEVVKKKLDKARDDAEKRGVLVLAAAAQMAFGFDVDGGVRVEPRHVIGQRVFEATAKSTMPWVVGNTLTAVNINKGHMLAMVYPHEERVDDHPVWKGYQLWEIKKRGQHRNAPYDAYLVDTYPSPEMARKEAKRIALEYGDPKYRRKSSAKARASWPATKEQLAQLERLGYRVNGSMNADKASRLITGMMARKYIKKFMEVEHEHSERDIR